MKLQQGSSTPLRGEARDIDQCEIVMGRQFRKFDEKPQTNEQRHFSESISEPRRATKQHVLKLRCLLTLLALIHQDEVQSTSF